MQLPSAKDIDPYDSLDGRSACKHFLGKSLCEAEALFREGSHCYMEDLMWMGPVAFRFYLPAAIFYIQSDSATKDSDGVNSFLGLLKFWLETEPAELFPVVQQLVSVCRYIVENHERFDVSFEIYGDFRARAQALKEAFLTDARFSK